MKRPILRGKQRAFVALSVFVLLFLQTCKDNGNPINGGKPPCPPIRIAAPSPYGEPTWHPSGGFIGFNYTPLEHIEYPYGEHCQGIYVRKFDSTGFWLINVDGSNMRRVFPYPLGEPAWSPDGGWIAFGADAQIYKMRFTGTTFDTTTLTQLTFEGRNFFPAWSPDGQWIAYDNTNCGSALEPPPPNSCGVLIMRNDGTSRRFVARGRYPHWSVDGSSLLYVGLRAEIFRVMVSDTSQVIRLTSFNQIDPYARDNRYPRYSPDATRIAFASRSTGYGDIWVMNADGSNPRQVTSEGTTDWLDWSPDGKKVVYVSYREDDWTYRNGTVWIVDVETGSKRQLTFNPPPQ